MRIILRGEAQKRRAIECIETADIDPAKPLAVTIEPHEEERSLNQNKLYRAQLGEAAREVGYSPKEMHDALLGEYFGTKSVTVGKTTIVSPLRRTTTNEDGKREVMTRKKWDAFYAWAMAFIATEYGVRI